MLIVNMRKDKIKDLIAQYYENGIPDMAAYLQDTTAMSIKQFEEDPVGAVRDGKIFCRKDQLGPAKQRLMDWTFEALADAPVDYLEFGVYKGASLKRAVAGMTSASARFYGFDTFEGLPDTWVSTWGNRNIKLGRDKGDLDSVGIPTILDERVLLYQGVFQKTLPEALADIFPDGRRSDRPLFINIDCDIYSGALYALTMIHPYLREGDLVYFDEFFDSMNEFAAFNDYIRSYYCQERFVPAARAYDAFLFTVKGESLSYDNRSAKGAAARRSAIVSKSRLSALKALIFGR